MTEKNEETKDLTEQEAKDMIEDAIKEQIKAMKEKEKKYPPVDWDTVFSTTFTDDEHLFDYILGQFRVVKSTQVPIAGVTYSPSLEKFVLLYNDVNMREILKETGKSKIRGIIKHEIYHVMLGHLSDRRPKNTKFAKIWNYATDLAINTNIPSDQLPEFCLLPGKEPFQEFKSNQTAEYYFRKIIDVYGDMSEEELEQMQCGEGDGLMPGNLKEATMGHDQWEKMNGEGSNLTDEEKAFMRQQAAQAGKELVEAGLIEEMDSEKRHSSRYGGKVPGNIPYNTYKEILEGNDITKFGIKELINKLSTSAIVSRKRKCSRKIYNKRMPCFSGVRRRDRVPHIVIAVDQSGSVDDDMVHMFFEVSARLNKYFKITILPFDTRVNENHIVTFEKGKFKGKHERTCSGGTEFDAVIEYTNKKYPRGNVDLIIVTDLGDSYPDTRSKNPIHWVASDRDIENSYDEKFLDHRLADLYEVSGTD